MQLACNTSLSGKERSRLVTYEQMIRMLGLKHLFIQIAWEYNAKKISAQI